MAGDYMPMRTDLEEDNRVNGISLRLGISIEHTIGCLFRIWKAFGTNTVDGKMAFLPREWVDRHVSLPGFGEAMEFVGWLIVTPEGLEMPRFDRWLSQSAKNRLEANRRKARSRACHENVTENCDICVTKIETREEKRREEKRKEEPSARASTQEYQVPSTEQAPVPPHPYYGRPSGHAPGWEEFWAIYPKKTNEDHARLEWDRLQPDEAMRAQILADVRAQRETKRWQEDDWRYATNPVKYLAERHWLKRAHAPEQDPSAKEADESFERTQREVAEKLRRENRAKRGLSP